VRQANLIPHADDRITGRPWSDRPASPRVC